MIRKRVFSLFLISFLFGVSFFGPAVKVRADAATLTVLGGSLGTAGAAAAALSGPVGVIIALALAAGGIGIYITEGSQAQGQTPMDFLQSQLVNYYSATGLDPVLLGKTLLEGVDVAKDGVIYLSDAATSIIAKIGNWIVGNEGNNYLDSSLIGSDRVATVNGVDVAIELGIGDAIVAPSLHEYDVISITSGNVFAYQAFISNKYYIGFVDVSSKSVGLKYTNLSSNYSTNVSTNLNQKFGSYYMPSGSKILPYVSAVPFDGIPIIPVTSTNNIGSYFSSLSMWNVNGDVTIDSDTFIGNPQDWADYVPGLALPDGYMGSIDAGVYNDILQQLQAQGEYILSVEDYLEAIREGLNEGAADVPLQRVEDGVIEYVDNVPLDVAPEYQQVAPQDVPYEQDLTPASNPDAMANPDSVIQGVGFDLKQLFPFCIPFDLYDILHKFVAQPVAPVIHIDWDLPFYEEDFELTLDFKEYNSLAAVVRNLELIALVVGLAMATRSIFLRS